MFRRSGCGGNLANVAGEFRRIFVGYPVNRFLVIEPFGLLVSVMPHRTIRATKEFALYLVRLIDDGIAALFTIG
jgi:hypothetical protein